MNWLVRGRIEKGLAFSLLAIAAVGCTGSKRSETPKPVVKDASYSMRMADSLFNGGRVSEALTALQEAIDLYPDNATLHLTYGGYCFRAARYDEARAALERAFEIDPYLTDAHNMLGVVYTEQQDYIAAEREFLAVLDDPAYPTPELTYLNLGQLYAEQGRDEEALAALRKAVGIDPKFFKAHFHLASLLDRIGNQLEAAREYEVAEPAFRQDGEYWYRRGFAYYRLGEHDKARDSLLRVRTISPGSESAARAEELLGVLD